MNWKLRLLAVTVLHAVTTVADDTAVCHVSAYGYNALSLIEALGDYTGGLIEYMDDQSQFGGDYHQLEEWTEPIVDGAKNARETVDFMTPPLSECDALVIASSLVSSSESIIDAFGQMSELPEDLGPESTKMVCGEASAMENALAELLNDVSSKLSCEALNDGADTAVDEVIDAFNAFNQKYGLKLVERQGLPDECTGSAPSSLITGINTVTITASSHAQDLNTMPQSAITEPLQEGTSGFTGTAHWSTALATPAVKPRTTSKSDTGTITLSSAAQSYSRAQEPSLSIETTTVVDDPKTSSETVSRAAGDTTFAKSSTGSSSSVLANTTSSNGFLVTPVLSSTWLSIIPPVGTGSRKASFLSNSTVFTTMSRVNSSGVPFTAANSITKSPAVRSMQSSKAAATSAISPKNPTPTGVNNSIFSSCPPSSSLTAVNSSALLLTVSTPMPFSNVTSFTRTATTWLAPKNRARGTVTTSITVCRRPFRSSRLQLSRYAAVSSSPAGSGASTKSTPEPPSQPTVQYSTGPLSVMTPIKLLTEPTASPTASNVLTTNSSTFLQEAPVAMTVPPRKDHAGEIHDDSQGHRDSQYSASDSASANTGGAPANDGPGRDNNNNNNNTQSTSSNGGLNHSWSNGNLKGEGNGPKPGGNNVSSELQNPKQPQTQPKQQSNVQSPHQPLPSYNASIQPPPRNASSQDGSNTQAESATEPAAQPPPKQVEKKPTSTVPVQTNAALILQPSYAAIAIMVTIAIALLT